MAGRGRRPGRLRRGGAGPEGGQGRAAGLAAALALLAGLAAAALWPAPPPGDRPVPALPAGPRPLAITAFGTSLTARYDWPAALAGTLSGCLGREVRMAVVAEPNAGSAWALTRVDRVAATRPDLILVEFAINDADLRDGVGLGRGWAQHDALLTALAGAAPQARVALMTMNPAGGLRGAMRPQLSRHYAALGPLADRHGAGLVDLTPRWRADRAAMAARPDGLHPEEAMARGVIVPPLAAAVAAALPGAPSCGAERG